MIVEWKNYVAKNATIWKKICRIADKKSLIFPKW